MIAKMNKTEISAKMLKRKKIKVFIIGITPENKSVLHVQGEVFLVNQT